MRRLRRWQKESCQQNHEWVLKNLRAWVSDRNARMSDKAVPDDQVACEDADVLCKCVLLCARDVHKENEENYPPSTLHLLLAAFQRILCMNMVPFNCSIRVISVS